MKKVEDYVRSIPDFPEEGIIFRDVTSVLQDADGLQLAINELLKKLFYESKFTHKQIYELNTALEFFEKEFLN